MTVSARQTCVARLVPSDDQKDLMLVEARPQGLAAPSLAAVWHSVLPSPNEERVARRRVHANALMIFALVAASYWALVIADFPLLVRLPAAGVLVLSLVAVGTSIMHGANHGSFSRHRWLNRTLSYTSDGLGASSWLWRMQHNGLHHGNTNVVGVDADLALAPFARLAPSQAWHWWYRGQYIYMWPLYGFLSLKNLLVSDLVTLIRRRMDAQPLRQPVKPLVVVRITLGKLAHLSWAVVVPLLFNPWWGVLAFYVACSWLVGFVLAVTFQLAHCVDATEMETAEAFRRGDDFVAHQLRTTADVASTVPVLGHLFRWLVGGLDHQVEHHLAPRLPHTLYPKVAKRFRAACDANGITYHLHDGLWSAIRSHTRWLRTMSRRPQPA
jgi:linoleoyl-CoA desaturase